MVSVVILTFNEARDLPRCLETLKWCDDVHVVDSGSTDGTLEIARQHGAHVWQRPFDTFANQRNWALDNCKPKHPWIFFLDADELVTPEFHKALLGAAQSAGPDVAGFYCCWQMIFMGRWMKRCDSFPKWQFRVVRKGRARFKDFGHGQKEDSVVGRLGYIKVPYRHEAFSKGMEHWLARHARYAGQEAAARLSARLNFRALFSPHGSVRNPALKLLLTRLPGWPVLRFMWPYVFKLGFLEGWPGFVYCVHSGYYEFLVKVRMKELQKQASGG